MVESSRRGILAQAAAGASAEQRKTEKREQTRSNNHSLKAKAARRAEKETLAGELGKGKAVELPLHDAVCEIGGMDDKGGIRRDMQLSECGTREKRPRGGGRLPHVVAVPEAKEKTGDQGAENTGWDVE